MRGATSAGVTAYLGLGSNLDDRTDYLRRVLALLHQPPQMEVRCCSSVYESDPVGPVQDQPPFFNVVVEVRTTLTPRALLRRCLEAEATMGRRRAREIPKGPRCIDVDLLLVGDTVQQWPELVLPHPELTNRAFVVLPMVEIAPAIKDPRDGGLLKDRAGELGARQHIAIVDSPLFIPSEGASKDPDPVNLFTVSSLRLHLPRRMPPTPGMEPSLFRRLWRRLRSKRPL